MLITPNNANVLRFAHKLTWCSVSRETEKFTFYSFGFISLFIAYKSFLLPTKEKCTSFYCYLFLSVKTRLTTSVMDICSSPDRETKAWTESPYFTTTARIIIKKKKQSASELTHPDVATGVAPSFRFGTLLNYYYCFLPTQEQFLPNLNQSVCPSISQSVVLRSAASCII